MTALHHLRPVKISAHLSTAMWVPTCAGELRGRTAFQDRDRAGNRHRGAEPQELLPAVHAAVAIDGQFEQVIHGILGSCPTDASGQGFPAGGLAGSTDLAVECFEGGDVDL